MREKGFDNTKYLQQHRLKLRRTFDMLTLVFCRCAPPPSPLPLQMAAVAAAQPPVAASEDDIAEAAKAYGTWPPTKKGAGAGKPNAAALPAANGGAPLAPGAGGVGADGKSVSFGPNHVVSVNSSAAPGTPGGVVGSGQLTAGTPLLNYQDIVTASDDDMLGAAQYFATPKDEYNAAYATFVLLGVGTSHRSLPPTTSPFS
jgi:hypothetical protein